MPQMEGYVRAVGIIGGYTVAAGEKRSALLDWENIGVCAIDITSESFRWVLCGSEREIDELSRPVYDLRLKICRYSGEISPAPNLFIYTLYLVSRTTLFLTSHYIHLYN